MIRLSRVEYYLRRFLYRLGYETRPIAPRDLRNITVDALHAAYLSGDRRCVINVPLAQCRDLLGFAFTPNTRQPLVQTAKLCVEGKISSYEESPLKAFHDSFQPKNVWELLRLPGAPNLELTKFPPTALILPWETSNLEKRRLWRIAATRRENINRGVDLGLEHGHIVGPITAAKGALEFQALGQLIEAIKSRGYTRNDRHDGDITATPLIDGKNGVRYLIRGGNHRIAALTALDFQYVPIRLRFLRAPRRDEVNCWPHVVDGIFTRDQALFVFDSIFHASPHAD